MGLSTGMAVCILLALYIQNELGFDNYQDQGNQIYRLALERKYPTRSAMLGHIPRSIGEAVKKEFPEVLESTRVAFDQNARIQVDDKTFLEKNVLTADSNFFKIFTGKFTAGDANTLEKPGTCVLNETTAKKYFGSVRNAIGKKVVTSNSGILIVGGICEDWPAKSHFNFNILISSSGIFPTSPEYVYFGPYCYLLLNKNTSAPALESKLPRIVDKYVSANVARLFGEPFEQFIKEGNGYRYFLQPLTDIHLHSELDDEMMPTVSFRTIRLFGAIGIFILFLACVNFINLSTALSVERAREVGIRKTFGSEKKALIGQFLSESLVFSFGSMLVALLIVLIFLPLLNKLSGNGLSFTYLMNPLRLLWLVGFSIFIGFIAGIYPSFVLSSFDPVMVLKGRFKTGRRGVFLRNSLVVFQFSISVVLIICTIVVNRQVQFMLGDSLGFKKDNIISIEGMNLLRHGSPGNPNDKRQAFLEEISKITGVGTISACDGLPGADDSQGGATWLCLDNNNSRTNRTAQVDVNYDKLLGLQIKEGRFFSKNFSSDSLSVVLNEKAVEDFGLKNPVGARLISKEPYYNSQDSSKGPYIFTVVGVVKDYHFQSLYKKIVPLVFINSNKFGWGSAGVNIHSNLKNAIAGIEKTWHQFDPEHDLTFNFLDQSLAARYKSENTEQAVFTVFSLLAILIASIGLLGLAIFSTVQRTKEISIRKVLGAASGSIVLILSKDFFKLIAIASLIAFPIAWFALHKWLQNFAYQTHMSWWIFIIAGSIAAVIALITISFQAIRAAISSPIKSLRAE
jgi:putative ABC transport system permease protein